MGDTYTRQSSYTDGDVITAAHTNNEFNQILAAFAASTGHTHDGTAAEGGPVTKLLGNTLTFGAGTAGTDITITFDGETSDGELKWMEDEDYFEFSDDILVASTEKIQFRDTAIYINSSADGQLDLVADTEIQLAATTVDLNGNLDVSGSITLGGTAITSTAAELNALDGITAVVGELNALDLGSTAVGNAIASKAVILDSNKDFTGLRNVTATGAVTGGSAVFDGGVAIDNITIDGTEIDLSSGDLTVDVAGDIILDAGGGDLKFAVAGTEILSVTNSSSDVIIKPIVDAKDIIFQQRDGTEVARIEDNGTFNVVTGKLAINGTAVTSTAAELNILDGVTSTAAELNILDGVTATASELNLLDGGTSVGSSITVADADGFVVNDGGTMKTIPATDVKTYAAGSAATKGFAIAMAIVFG